jgi:hypothetical protein
MFRRGSAGRYVFGVGAAVALVCAALAGLDARGRLPAPPEEKKPPPDPLKGLDDPNDPFRRNPAGPVSDKVPDDVEAAVTRGLRWLALHQHKDGHWSLTDFPKCARTEPLPDGKAAPCNCGGAAKKENEVAATALAVLPFLGAGCGPKPTKEKNSPDYSETVKAGLEWLVAKQDKGGSFDADLLVHGQATLALCQAYGLTADPKFKEPSQRALDYLVKAQDPKGGGWGHTKDKPAEVVVTGWVMMALKSGQMAGLDVRREALNQCDRFIDSCETEREVTVEGRKVKQKGGYGNAAGMDEAPLWTAEGLLCKQYLGANPRNPGLLAGAERLKENPPGKAGDLAFEFFAAQVMHHMGGDNWKFWSEGPEGKNGLRDVLSKRQDGGDKAKRDHQKGSWGPDDLGKDNDGGRLTATALSLLTLEVYYQHSPLYRRDLDADKNKDPDKE